MSGTYPGITYTFAFQDGLARDLPTGFYLPNAINDFGEIAGDLTLRGPSTAFVYNAGVVNTAVVTGSFEFSFLGGVNDFGQLSGSVTTGSGAIEAIVISGGTQQVFTYPGSSVTQASGINIFGQIAGSYTDASGSHGFAGTPGHLHAVDRPGASQTMAYGINDWGQIAGTYVDASGTQHGFVDTKGHFDTIDVPGATSTIVSGINDLDQIAGSYVDSANVTHGFVISGGRLQTLDAPGAFLTRATGINNLGQVVGYSESVSTAGAPPLAQVWVAGPSFIHGPHAPDDAGLTVPAFADVAGLVRALAENLTHGHAGGWWTDPTGGGAAPSPDAGLTSGWSHWVDSHGSETWSLPVQHGTSG